jgi:hypothetical protein
MTLLPWTPDWSTGLLRLARQLAQRPFLCNAGHRHLEGMRQLRRLELLHYSNVSAEGVARLKAALPKCTILH